MMAWNMYLQLKVWPTQDPQEVVSQTEGNHEFQMAETIRFNDYKP